MKQQGRQKRRTQSKSGSDAPRPQSGWTRTDWMIVATVVAAVLVVFGRTLSFGFLNLDDDVNITANPHFHPPSWNSLWTFWSAPYEYMYIPLTYTTWLLDSVIGSGKPWMFHLTNVAIHAASAGLLYALIGTLMNAAGPKARIAAGIGALIFALHPVQAEPVSWITGRKDVLSGFFAILSSLLYVRADADPDQKRPGSKAGSTLALVAFIAGLISKPAVASLPAVLWILQVGLRKRSIRNTTIRLLPFFASSAVFIGISSWSQMMPDWIQVLYPIRRRPLIVLESLGQYLRLVVSPRDLAPIFPTGVASVSIRTALPWTIALSALAGVALWLAFRRRQRAPLALLTAFAAALAPVLGFVPFLYQETALVADRYLYLAMAVAGISVALAMHQALGQFGEKVYRQCIIIGFATVGVAMVSILTWMQTSIWRDSLTLWSWQTAVRPQVSFGYVKLGETFARSENPDKAAPAFRQALALDLVNPEARKMLGVVLMDKFENPAEAMPLFDTAAKQFKDMEINDVRLAECINNKGVALLRMGRDADAAQEFRAALQIVPDHPAFLANLKSAGDSPSPGP